MPRVSPSCPKAIVGQGRRRCTSRWALWAGLFSCAVWAGCRPADPIREYVVRKPPTAGSLWFFKLIGPEAAVAQSAPALREFVATVTFHGQTGLPQWKLPDGWTEEAAANSVRFKTLRLPGDGGLEVAVTQIGGKVPPAPDDERMQANMLREQVGLKAESDVAPAATEGDDLQVDGHAARVFDFTGETPKFGKTRVVAAMVPVPKPPSAGIAGTDGRALPFTYQTPSGWQNAPGTQFSVVSMAVSDGEESATMTITPAMGGVLANINRWRGQAELPTVAESDLPELLVPIETGGLTILFAEVTGAKRSILGAVVPMDAGTWFVKLDGPPRLVKDETERFREFLKSFRAVE